VSSRASIKATIQPVLEVGKNVYIWPIFQQRIEVTSRAIIKATLQPLLEESKDAYILPILKKV
jgi:hypothetical protein